MAKTHQCCFNGLKIFTKLTLVSFLCFLAILIILFLTLLKPKEPKIEYHSITLQNYHLQVSNSVHLNVTLEWILTIHNLNYGGFKYNDAITYVSYHGEVIAEVLVENGSIPGRMKHNNVSSSLIIRTDKFT